MFRAAIVTLIVLCHSMADAAEFKVGDRVFWKNGTRAHGGANEISIATFSFPSTVRDIRDGDLFLGSGWISQEDALSVEDAMGYFTEQIELEPSEPSNWTNRGRVWSERKDFERAIADYLEAAKLAPHDDTNHNNLGTAHQAKGDYAGAVKHFDSALRTNPNNPTAYYNRGRANQYAGHFAEATKDYAEAIRVGPNYLPAYNNAAWLAATCPDEKYRDGKKALQYAEKAVELSGGKVWEVLDSLAAAQAESGDFAAAVNTAEQALQMGDEAAVHAGVQDHLNFYKQRKPWRIPDQLD